MNNWLYRLYERMLWSQVRTGPSPNHIGLIVDGNRRFAEGRGLSKNLGHEEGSRRLEEFLRWCWRLEIKIVTLYGGVDSLGAMLCATEDIHNSNTTELQIL